MDILNFRVLPDTNSLELWVKVPEDAGHGRITIEKIAIIDYSKYEDDTTYPTTENKIEFTVHAKEFKSIVSLNNPATRILLGTNKSGMYYVYVKATGLPDPDICFKEITLGIAVNHFPVYNLLMKIICGYEDRCFEAEDKITDIYMKKQLIDLAVELGDYTVANRVFAEFYKREIDKGFCISAGGNKTVGIKKGCSSCG